MTDIADSGSGSATMHERVSKLEANHQSVIGRMDAIEHRVGNIDVKMDKMLEFMSEAKTKQLPPIQTILVTALSSFALISTVIGGLYWIIDTRVGSGIQRANAFVEKLADGPDNIFVILHDYNHRISAIEKNSDYNLRYKPLSIIPEGKNQ